MIRDDNSNFLLYMEPKLSDKSIEPADDGWTKLVEYALKTAKSGTSNYESIGTTPSFNEHCAFRGVHQCCDGTRSSNRDYLLPNGMITNSLAPHYLRWFRKSISENDWIKLKKLKDYYKTMINDKKGQ